VCIVCNSSPRLSPKLLTSLRRPFLLLYAYTASSSHPATLVFDVLGPLELYNHEATWIQGLKMLEVTHSATLRGPEYLHSARWMIFQWQFMTTGGLGMSALHFLPCFLFRPDQGFSWRLAWWAPLFILASV